MIGFKMGAIGFLTKPVSLDKLSLAFEKIENNITKTIKHIVGGITFNTAHGIDEPEEGHYAFSDIAILTRTRAARQDIVNYLERENIPYSLHNAATLFSEPPFSHIISFITLATNETDIVA